MKQLESQFVQDDNQFTQIKRSEKAALYKRETKEGAFVSYEVFAIRTKNDQEIYPNKKAFGGILGWAWCPITLDRAETYYDRLNKGEVVLADVDPETGELNGDAPAVVVTLPVNGQTAVSLTPDMVGDDIVQPTQTPEVTTTTAGAKLVTVAKVENKQVNWKIPTGEFTQAQFAQANKLPERGVVWSRLDQLVRAGRLTKAMKKLGKGRPSAVFTEKK